jgi:hypothetical protein
VVLEYLSFILKKYTDTNNIRAIKIGGDVGYQNVMVKQSNNGLTEHLYLPIDYPEAAYDGVSDIYFPFVPNTNFDYKRGLL